MQGSLEKIKEVAKTAREIIESLKDPAMVKNIENMRKMTESIDGTSAGHGKVKNLRLNNHRHRFRTVSPKRRVAIMTVIFAAVGVGVSVGIIAAGGGFSAGPALFFDPPSEADIWQVGNNIHDGTELDYSLTARDESNSLESAQVSMVFVEAGSNWDVEFSVVNGTDGAVENTVTMSKQLTREGQLAESFRPYFEPIQSSIFAVRDMEYGESAKYLVMGAPWNQIFYKSSQVIVRVTGEETVQTQAGTFDAFVLSYKLEENTSRIWVVRDMPLPVKAQVYDSEDKLQYEYELTPAAGV